MTLLALAAIAFVIGGVDHARLFHRGYAQVEVVGPLFLLNAIGTLVVVLLLLDRRIVLFLGGVLSISLGSIVSILISHSSSFFGFAERGYDGDATIILVAEIASVILALAAGAAGALRDTAPAAAAAAPPASRPGPLQLGLAVAAVLVLGLPIAGVATGGAPKNDPAPTGAELAASKAAIKNGNAAVQMGMHLFESQHCDTCHAIAATGAKGILGPRMDAQGDPVKDISTNITEPRVDIAEGFEAKLMPTDYASKMNGTQIKDLATFIKAASTTGKKKGGGDGDDG